MSMNMTSPTIVPEHLYTSEEVADLLRVSLRTVQRLLQAGSLKSFKIHGQYRIKGLDLLGYLDGVRLDSETLALTENKPADLLARLALAPVALQVSTAWAQAIATSAKESKSESEPTDFLSQLQSLRERISQELGFVLPGLRIQDQSSLNGGQYQILIQGQVVAQGEWDPEGHYRLEPPSVKRPSQHKPLERLAETYVPTEKKPESLSGAEVLLRHLEGIVRAFAHEILSREEVFVMSEALRKSHPVVLDEILSLDGPQPGKLTIGQLTRILKQLLEEKVSIRPLAQICESLADGLDQGLNGSALHEKVRQGLARPICANVADSQGVIRVLTLSQNSQTALRQAFAKEGPELQELARSLQEALLREIQTSRVLLCTEDLRRPIFELLARNFSAWQVISTAEIDRLFWLSSVAELEL